MLSPDGQEGPRDALVLIVLGLLATAVRLASNPPRSVARTAWLLLAGLGLATGGWVLAHAIGLHGWSAMAMAWISGALGSETMLPVVRRWLESRLGPSPPPGLQGASLSSPPNNHEFLTCRMCCKRSAFC